MVTKNGVYYGVSADHNLNFNGEATSDIQEQTVYLFLILYCTTSLVLFRYKIILSVC